MTRKISQTNYFIKLINNLIKKRQILQEDFDNFKKELAQHPEMGDMIPGTNGVRKARLKSASHGKRGGSRICYYDINHKNEIFLLLVYLKNQQENLTSDEMKILKEIAIEIRRNSK